jgi:hypothetical protein
MYRDDPCEDDEYRIAFDRSRTVVNLFICPPTDNPVFTSTYDLRMEDLANFTVPPPSMVCFLNLAKVTRRPRRP